MFDLPDPCFKSRIKSNSGHFEKGNLHSDRTLKPEGQALDVNDLEKDVSGSDLAFGVSDVVLKTQNTFAETKVSTIDVHDVA